MNAPTSQRERAGPVTVFQNQRVLMVRNLRPGLPERGKIKIGVKGEVKKSGGGKEFQPPKKLDHFVITTLRRGPDGNFVRDEELHKSLGSSPTEIPIRLLYNDPWLSFQTSYAAFKGKTRWCSGDGETALRMGAQGQPTEIDCPCERLDFGYSEPDKCKINGVLSVVIDGAQVIGGVWKLRTTSINTCQGIASSLAMIAGMTGGILAGIPLMLTLQPKTATTPEGAMTTVYVVGLEYRGSADQLREIALRQAMSDASYGERMRRLEDDARRLLEAPAVGGADLDAVEEFYPDAAKVAHGLDGRRAAEPAPILDHDPLTGEVVEAGPEAGGELPSDDPDPLKIMPLPLREAVETLTRWLEDRSTKADAAAAWWRYRPQFEAKGNGWQRAAARIEGWLAEWGEPTPADERQGPADPGEDLAARDQGGPEV